MFGKPTPLKLAQDELEEAKRKLLEAETALEWSQANVTYNKSRIERLTARIKEWTPARYPVQPMPPSMKVVNGDA